MNDITRLQAEIAEKQAALAELEAEVLDLRSRLDEFQTRYDRVVGPVNTRLEAVRAAIAELERQRWLRESHPLGDYRPLESDWQPPPDYVPVEEQFRRTWQVPRDNPTQPDVRDSSRPRLNDENLTEGERHLKRLYRQLARRFHPDLVADPAERTHRTELMARINEAYSARDLATLLMLAEQPDAGGPAEPLAALQLQELRQINAQLRRRITDLQFERTNLIHSDLMQFMLEDKLAKSRGHDLLAEIAAQLEQEYAEAMRRLEELRYQ